MSADADYVDDETCDECGELIEDCVCDLDDEEEEADDVL